LAAQSGKPVADPDLQDIQITPELTEVGGNTTIRIQATGKASRLWQWKLMKDRLCGACRMVGCSGVSPILRDGAIHAHPGRVSHVAL
jgi:hypothetical protein